MSDLAIEGRKATRDLLLHPYAALGTEKMMMGGVAMSLRIIQKDEWSAVSNLALRSSTVIYS